MLSRNFALQSLLLAAALVAMNPISARAADVCMSVVGDGVALREDPWEDVSNVIAWFDTGPKLYVLGPKSEGWWKLKLTYDINNKDVEGWMLRRNLRPAKCPLNP
jgi:hypothetical protein